ncbi:hypothetical protein GCM10011519_15800 [Marmoricola endophyticus]|uniref:DUF4190 domain-containing protein n=1 Tax=Marmoricola endophyticus TaxID=2040280 RepID=A0A917BGR0_9ACTN|nr:DUF4190 domain-containing protein [Marmoricola endophyticus]GGF42749.1 hypothetical protein GCM10011519_15800 [Marmoricola endophyticus]
MSQSPPPPPENNPYGQQPPSYGDQPVEPGQSYPPPAPGQGYPPAQPKGGSGLAIGALVLGILALLLSLTVVGGILLGLVALILGIVASGRAKRGVATGRGIAITGIVLGVIGALISIGVIVVGVLFVNSDSGKNLQDCVNNAQTQADRDQCSRDFANDLQN